MSDVSPTTAPLSLDELVALGDEIAALIRAGVPLDQGLAGLGHDLPGRTGRLTRSLAERLGRGEALADALAAERGTLPASYHAVIEAGQAAGRLPAALESLSRTARRLSDVEQSIKVAMVYPLTVMMVAYTLGVAFLVYLSPYFQKFAASVDPALGVWLQRLVWLGETAKWWVAVVPLCMVLLVGLAAVRPGTLLQSGWRTRLWQWLPGMRRLVEWSRIATLCEILTLLVEQGVPLPKALRLSARASGDAKLERAALELSEAAERGEPMATAFAREKSLPRFLVWLLMHGAGQGELPKSLQHAAAIYRDRALWQAEMVRHWGGIVLTLVLGGVAVAGFALLLFVPLTSILQSVGAP